MEDLHFARNINNSDIEHVYAGLFMELFTDFDYGERHEQRRWSS